MEIRAFARYARIRLWLRFVKRSNSSKLELKKQVFISNENAQLPASSRSLCRSTRGKGVTSGVQCCPATRTQPADTNWLVLPTWRRWRRPASRKRDGCISRANNCSACTSREVHRDAALFRGPRPSASRCSLGLRAWRDDLTWQLPGHLSSRAT